MTETAARTTTVRFTVDDLELFPDDLLRREIVDGELFVSRAPHPEHERPLRNIGTPLDIWSKAAGVGEVHYGIGIAFSREDAVIPDLVWASHQRWAQSVDAEGRLVRAPELVVEVLSPSAEDVRRDREVKRKLYSVRGVDEYWIVDRFTRTIEVYRRQNAQLVLAATLRPGDTLTSPLLPGFALAVADVFAPIVPPDEA